MQVQVPVRTQQECKNAFRNFKTTVIDNRVLCAGYANGGKDACQVRNNRESYNRNYSHQKTKLNCIDVKFHKFPKILESFITYEDENFL